MSSYRELGTMPCAGLQRWFNATLSKARALFCTKELLSMEEQKGKREGGRMRKDGKSKEAFVPVLKEFPA